MVVVKDIFDKNAGTEECIVSVDEIHIDIEVTKNRVTGKGCDICPAFKLDCVGIDVDTKAVTLIGKELCTQ